jgi:hypothetical protein
METVKALDGFDQFKAQQDVLLRRAGSLANKAAAAQHIPTPWKWYVVGAGAGVFFGWQVVFYTRLLLNGEGNTLTPIDWAVSAAMFVFSFVFNYQCIVYYYVHTLRERRRFIAEGCSANFVPKLGPWEWRRAADRERFEQQSLDVAMYLAAKRSKKAAKKAARMRAKRMKKAGLMPEEWPPHSARLMTLMHGIVNNLADHRGGEVTIEVGDDTAG